MGARSLQQAIKEEKEFREVNFDYDDDGGPNDDECIDHFLDECGHDGSGGCSLAGTEYCDWDCPFS